MTESKPIRHMNIVPAWDCILVQPCVHGVAKCKPGSGSSHGRHNAELYMSVQGRGAEVILGINTGWYLGDDFGSVGRAVGAIEVTWHTSWPQEEQAEEDARMPHTDGTCRNWDACYMQSSGTTGNQLFELLITKGSEPVYEWLEKQYYDLVKGRKVT